MNLLQYLFRFRSQSILSQKVIKRIEVSFEPSIMISIWKGKNDDWKFLMMIIRIRILNFLTNCEVFCKKINFIFKLTKVSRDPGKFIFTTPWENHKLHNETIQYFTTSVVKHFYLEISQIA
jgi:hypothetical protein